MRLVVGGWRLAWALLIAVSTALLFSTALQESPVVQRGASDESCAPGHHEVPVVSLPQESIDRSARRDDSDALEPPRHEFVLVQVHAFTAWPLPAPTTSPRSRAAGGRYARGPPITMC